MLRTEYGRLRKVVLSKPTYYRLLAQNLTTKKYIEENKLPNLDIAIKEHAAFTQAFIDFGVEVVEFEPDQRYAYQTFTRDFCIMTPKGAVISKMCTSGRQGEELVAENGLLKAGIPVIGHITRGTCEGGDYMYVDRHTLAMGCGGRSNMEGIRNLREIFQEWNIDVEIMPVQFHPDHVHLDCVGSIVGEKVAICCLDVIPTAYYHFLKDRKFEIVTVPVEDVIYMTPNVMPLDKDTILSSASNKDVNGKLRALGFKVIAIEMPEILKAGGGPHCLCCAVDRDM